MQIAVVDGQGGGIGKAIIEKLRAELGDGITILALGTNSLATSLMLKAGANEGATGRMQLFSARPERMLLSEALRLSPQIPCLGN